MGAFEPLSGGLANANVRVGDRVLRIYRRDPSVLRKEAALLRRRWSFRVPRILDEGEDFLVLEYVPHRPLEGTADEGAAVGRALAEIHAIKFDRAGFLGPDLRVADPFPDLLTALRNYVSFELRASPLHTRVLAALDELRAGPPTLLHADWKASNLHATDRGLLVLDWEFAYSGCALSDIGQLLRWPPPESFVEAFAAAYGPLPDDWRRQAELFDLVNLAGIYRRSPDVARRMEATLR